MKKYYTTLEWKERSKRRASDELAKAREANEKRRRRRRQIRSIPKSFLRRKRPLNIRAPEVLSLRVNPEGILRFLGQLRAAFERHNDVHVDLSGVTELTSDAVVVLLSKLNDPAFSKGNHFGGNQPRNEAARELLRQSGFFDYVSTQQLIEPPEHGRIRRKTSFVVESDVAADLIEFATKKMTGQPGDRPGVYRVLVECMGNTHEHAGGDDDTIASQSWWATVYAPPDGNRSFFTFVDNGVGIFRSVTMRRIRRYLAKAFGPSLNPGLLKEILEGRLAVPSRTGKRNRGKGLKAIYRQLKLGRIARLVIIANDVYADVALDSYRAMAVPFIGTFVYWELER